MKRSLAFTLVELLAVIVILAIILAIAVPSITGVINSSTRSAFLSDAKMVIKAIDYKLLEDDTYDITSVTESNIESELGVSDDNYQNVEVYELRGKPYVVIVGKNKWANLMTYGTYSTTELTDSTNYDEVTSWIGYDSVGGVNAPVLATGMTPIKWNGTSWVETLESDSDWYSYDTTNKKWANAKTADGSMWVWIPRYAYKITSNWHSNTTGTIDVSFSMGTDDTRGGTVTLDTGTTANASNNKWTNHPGFTFGDDEVTGIWVAKFEPSNDGSDNIKVIPNVNSWRDISVGDAFDECRSMETNSVYGWGTSGNGIDTHLMKNSEWGAVSYLSKSTYGQNTNEIWINPADDFTTGCAGDSVSSAATSGCLRTYETTNGVKASTTGTIYGIYDISGGAWEYVSAYVDNSNSSLNTYGSSILSADSKYKDIYTVGATDDRASNYALAINFKGDAVYETSSTGENSTSWFADYSYMPYTSSPWFRRGGHYNSSSGAGAEGFSSFYGGASSSFSFRSVLLVNAGI